MNLLFIVGFMTMGSNLFAQTTVISGTGDGSFEGSFASTGWSTAQSAVNAWVVGTAGGATHGTNAAYVNSTGTAGGTWSYNTGSTQANHIYRDFTYPVGEDLATLTFDLKGTPADVGFDRIRVFVCPTTVTPVAGTEVTAGATQLYSNDAAVAAYTTQTVSFTKATTGGTSTGRIIITWRNDGSVGSGQPYTVDKVNLLTAAPASFSATIGGLWSSPATWGGTVPGPGNDIVIPVGVTVTVDQLTSYRNITVNGTLVWNGTANAMTLSGNLIVNAGGIFLPYSTTGTGVVVNIAGNFQNDGYCNLAVASTNINFNGTGSSTLSGTGVFQGNATKGIIRTLSFQTPGSNSITTSQNLIVTNALVHSAGSLNTNGKLTVDNTAQVYGQAFNLQVANLAVTSMGTLYSVAPVVFGTAVTQYANALAATLGTRYVSGSNVYLCTAAGTFNATPPTSTNLQATFTTSGPTLLYIGTVGTLGTNLPFNNTLSLTTQYFHGGNVYQALAAASITSAANMPVHTSGVVNNLLYLGTVATATVNWNAATQTVRSLNLTSPGSGFSTAPAINFSIGAVGATGSGAVASAVLFQQIAGAASSTFSKGGGAATVSGGITINSDQGTSVATTNPQASTGVGALSTSNGGLNYTTAPTIGFAGPTALNLVVNPGSSYAAAPTITVTGGNLVSGTALTTANFTITVNNGMVESVYLNTLTTATYSTPPTLAFSSGTGTLAFPAGCWPAATASIGSNGQLTNFTVTNAGYGYNAAPTVGIGTTSGTANGGVFTTVASAPTARVGLYNLTLGFFLPAPVAVVNGDDAAIPASRKINVLTLAGTGRGLNLTGPLTVYANSAALSLTASGNAPGNVLDLGGNNIYFSGNAFAGVTATFGVNNTYIKNGSMTLTGRGGGSTGMTFNYPFSGTFTWNSGAGAAVTAGASTTLVTVSDTAAPTNASIGTGIAIGNRAFRVQLGQIGTPGFLVNPVTGTNPQVTMNFNSDDALTVTQDQLFVSEATALLGAWTVRSVSSGSGALPATGSRATATVAPGPIVPTTNSFYAWSTSAPTITSVTPTTLCANSGAFTITGTNFTGVTAVTIGGIAVTSFTVVSATSITGFAGAGANGFFALTKGGATVTGTDAITILASPAAPSVSPTSASVNLGGTVTFTASGGAGTFNWYNVASGGTAIFTGATYSAPACASGNLYVSENSGGCDGPRTPVSVTVAPTVITASPATFCGTGGSVTLSVTPNDPSITYTWTSLTPSATITSSNVGQSITATVTENSDFQVTATNGACTATAFFSVSVYPLPSATVTTTANGVCPGTSATINSGLSAGNFVSASITHAPKTAPGSAVTLATGGAAVVPQTSGTLDDGGWGSIPVGFGFNFFGTTYNTINIGTNGTLMFGTYNGTALADFTFTTLPSASEPLNMVAVLAMDNDLSTSGTANGTLKYWTEGIAPNRKFVVSYQAVREFGDVLVSTAQAIFYETTGFIEVHVTSSTNVDRNKLVGVNNSNGTVGVLAYASGTTASASPQNPITSPFAFRFSPPSNYTTVWTADTGSGPVVIASGTNIFSQSVAPLVSTTYSISYTNQTTGCTNAPGSAQVLMGIVSNVAPTTTAVATPATVCLGSSTTLTLTGNVNNLGNTAGLTYQWQEDTGSGYTNISGAIADTFVATPTVVTSYRCIVTACGGSPVTGIPVIVSSTNQISAAGSSNCGPGLANLTATSGTAGATIAWYAAATGGTSLATGSPFQPTVSTTTTYYVAAETVGPNCSSFRIPVTATVTTPAVPLTLSSNAATYCTGSSAGPITLTSGTGFYDTYSWSPATGVTGDEFIGWTFNPTTSTTYTLTASQTGGLFCNATATFTVTVNSANVTTAVTDDTLCAGATTTLSASSTLLPAGPTSPPTGYGSSNATSTADEEILNVTFGSLNNTSTCATTGGPGSILNEYSDFTAVTAPNVVMGSTVPVSVNVGTCGGIFTSFTNVYIDYNRNGIFESTERAFSSTVGVSGPHLVSGSITIPTTALPGVTRMRVLNIENGSTASLPTGTYGFGETEDYNVNIVSQDATSTYTYNWTSAPAGFTATGSSVPAIPAVTTVYTVIATAPNGCSTTGTVTVTVAPAVDNITGGAAAMCIGSGTIDFDTTTIGVTWTSSNPAVATVDANGVVTALAVGTTVIGAQIFNSDPAYNCTTYAANPQTVNVYAPLAITTQPSPQSVLDPSVATFSVVATGSIVGYQWQISPNGTTGWTNLSNNATYSGVLTATLSINATIALNAKFYRCVITGNAPCATPLNSNSALLTVSNIAVCGDPASVSICTTGTGCASFTACFTPTPDEIVWEYFDGTDWVVIDGTETTLGSVTYTGETTATITLCGLSIVNDGWKMRANGILGASTVTTAEATITVSSPATISGQPANASVCYSGGTTPFTVTSAGGTGFQWQYSTSASGPWTNVANSTPAGTTYTGATTATLNVATTAATPAAGTYFYQVIVTSPGTCANTISSAAELQIKTPVITASAAPGFICNPGGSPVTLTASGAGSGGSYSWSPATGLSATNLAVVTANPTVTTTYTVTGTDSTGCSNTATVTVIVAPALVPTATATPATVCNGANSQLLAASGLNDEGTPSAYCTPTVGFSGASDDFINDFVFADISNLGSGDDPADYTDFTSLTANVVGGTTYPISITPGTLFAQGFRVWIDYNKNGVFEASESAYTSTGASTATSSGNITIPVTALNGVTRLRVADRFNAVPGAGEACGHSGFGEYEDYSVSITGATNAPTYTYSWSPSTFLSATNIKNPVATAVTATTTYTVTVTSSTGCTATQNVTVTLAAGIAITTQPADASFCQGTTATLSVVATGAGLTYQWRKGGVDISGATLATLSIPTAAVADSGSYDVVINDVCGSAAVTSSVAILTINPTPTATNPGPQTFCAGTTTAVSLTGTPSGVTFNITGGAAIGLANQTGVTAIPSFTALAGSATLSITPTANGCNGSAVSVLFTINPTPATPTVGSNTPVNCGSNLNLTASTVSITGYSMNPSSGVAFIDIAGTGTSVGTLSDDSEHNITIPSFIFNGITYTTARVGMNGAIVFGSTTGEVSFSNGALPSTANSAGNVFLAPFWDDLDIQTAATIVTQTVGSIYIVQYTTAAHDAFTTGSITFQVQMDLVTGAISYVYPDVIFGNVTQDAGASATVGIQMSATSAVQYSLNTASLTNGQSITFTPNSASYSWTGPNGFTSSVQNPTITGVTAAAAGNYTLVVSNPATGCAAPPVVHSVSVVNCNSIVDLKFFIEGYYTGSGTMNTVAFNQTGGASTDVEMVTVELFDATLTSVASTTAMLHTDGTCQAVFPPLSGSYYIAVRGSNSIRTWSAATQTVGSTPLTYDFSTGAAQAAGGNMKDLGGSGVFGFYSGDLDLPLGDGFIDLPDYSIWEADFNLGSVGAYPTDLDGDAFVDLPDYSIWEANFNAGITEIQP